MNETTFGLLRDVAARLERAIRSRDCPAIVALESQRRLVLSDYDYLRDDQAAHAFEDRAGEHARRIEAIRFVFAVSRVWVVAPGQVAARAASNHPLRPGEQEAITWLSFDITDGVDYGRVPYARRPNGEPIFDEPESFTVEVWPEERMPGFRLLRVLIADDGDSIESRRPSHQRGRRVGKPAGPGEAEGSSCWPAGAEVSVGVAGRCLS
ncbi:hypothetical protein [Actinomadura sp. 9N215]|uniref:hypothetical protein n=1 Tax=Actinomadura sp. 9N215 TaxID=3375150 RepID=UPI00378DCCAE